jgi:GNAT superfamily N-acetyltransferase
MISYRRADTKDINDLVRMRLQFVKEAQHVDNNDKDAEMTEGLRKFFSATMPGDEFIAWIAEEDGRMVGTSGLCFFELAPSYKNMSGRVAYIQNMYTLPEYRGRGIAKILFDKLLTEAKELAAKLAQLSVKILTKSGEGGRLFGSITSKDIADALADQHKIIIDKRKFVMENPIKHTGDYEVDIKIYSEVTAKLKVTVAC